MKRKKGYRSVALVLVLFMVITAVMMQTECEVYAATPVSSHGRLSVKGADLVDKNKKKFQLRGISTHGINWEVGSPYVNKAAFKTLRDDWGANAVRLAMYTSDYNGVFSFFYCFLKNLFMQIIRSTDIDNIYRFIFQHLIDGLKIL